MAFAHGAPDSNIFGRIALAGGPCFSLTAEGRLEEARQALKASVKDSEDSVEGIERLVKSAEEAADWEEAARLARRLASLVGTQDPSPSMRLADFLERAGETARCGDRLAGAGGPARPDS